MRNFSQCIEGPVRKILHPPLIYYMRQSQSRTRVLMCKEGFSLLRNDTVDNLLISYLGDPLSFLISKTVVSRATPPPTMYGKYSHCSSSDMFTAFRLLQSRHVDTLQGRI